LGGAAMIFIDYRRIGDDPEYACRRRDISALPETRTVIDFIQLADLPWLKVHIHGN
jgi:hypothetical protein